MHTFISQRLINVLYNNVGMLFNFRVQLADVAVLLLDQNLVRNSTTKAS